MSDPNNNVPVPQIVSGVFAGGSNPNAIAVGNPNTAIGRVIAAIQAANPATGSMGGSPFGSNGSTINSHGTISNSLGTATGQSLFTSNLSSLFGPRPNAPDPDAGPTVGPVGLVGLPPGALPDDPDDTGVDPETGLTPGVSPAPPGPTPDPSAGGSPDGGGNTSDGSPGGPAGGEGGAQAAKRGGKVRRPDPRKLSGMLKKGAKVRTGDDDDETDDVEVRLTKGETVLNKTASDKHAKTLAKWNAGGNRITGGFGVGQPRTQRR
jgi:hypothetical protein